jgi:hypothetical protein
VDNLFSFVSYPHNGVPVPTKEKFISKSATLFYNQDDIA